MEPIFNVFEHSPVLDMRFNEYLRDKSVAIIGRGSPLHEMEQGEFIDSHDVVVRIHQAIPYNSNYENDNWKGKNAIAEPTFVPQRWQTRIGTKCNVFYHRIGGSTLPADGTRVVNANEEFLVGVIDRFKRAGGKFLCFEHDGKGRVSPRFAVTHELMPVRYMSMEHCLNVYRYCDYTIVNIGIVIIFDILKYSVKSAYVTGFPCLVDREASPKNIEELQVLANLRGDGRVTFDSYMGALFEEHCVHVGA